MAYQLQPGLSIVQTKVLSPSDATDEIFVYPQPVLSTVVGAAPTPCYTGLLPTWLVRVPQHSTSRRVMSSVPNPLPVSTRISSKPMNEICSHCPTWSVRLHFAHFDMNPRALAPNSRMVCFRKGILIKMLIRSKNG